MLVNKFFDPSHRNVFMLTIPGFIEHQLKLSSIHREAKSKHKDLAVCLLDLANAYCSVHHSQIQQKYVYIIIY